VNGFLIPANAKKGTLIFNIFRPFDLILFGTGIGITFLLLVLLGTNNMVVTIISLLPVCITGLLVFPVPNYQNVLCVLQSINRFYSGRRRYVWRGWCFYEQFKDSSKKQ
jgi:hypothetical protein